MSDKVGRGTTTRKGQDTKYVTGAERENEEDRFPDWSDSELDESGFSSDSSPGNSRESDSETEGPNGKGSIMYRIDYQGNLTASTHHGDDHELYERKLKEHWGFDKLDRESTESSEDDISLDVKRMVKRIQLKYEGDGLNRIFSNASSDVVESPPPPNRKKTSISKTSKHASGKEESSLQKSTMRSSFGQMKTRKATTEAVGDKKITSSVMSSFRLNRREQEKRPLTEREEEREKLLGYLREVEELEKRLDQDEVEGSRSRIDQASSTSLGKPPRSREASSRLLFPPSDSGSSSSESEEEINADVAHKLLEAITGRHWSFRDIAAKARLGQKWLTADRPAPLRKKEYKRVEEEIKKEKEEFDQIFGGHVEGSYHDLTREELLAAHEKIGAWVHHHSQKLDKYIDKCIETRKYPPHYLLYHWNGEMTDDDSDDVDFDKHREAYQKKLADYEAQVEANPDNPPPPLKPEDRVPTLQENKWFLFPTPLTRGLSKLNEKAVADGHRTQADARVAMEGLVKQMRRRRDIEKARKFTDEHAWPPPSMFPPEVPVDEPEAKLLGQVREPDE